MLLTQHLFMSDWPCEHVRQTPSAVASPPDRLQGSSLICAGEERVGLIGKRVKKARGLEESFSLCLRAFGLNDSPSTSFPLAPLQLSSWPQCPLGHQHCNSIQVKHAQLLFPFWSKCKSTPPPWKRLCLTCISLGISEKGAPGLAVHFCIFSVVYL